jgi:uncharacterized membrane protein YgcG
MVFSVVLLSSCTTAYRTGQTPDDVYFSPSRPIDEYVRVEENDNQYRSDDEYYDDRYLRMKVHNYNRWDYFNDWYAYDRYSYRYNNYGYNNYFGYGSYWNPYNSWNYFYNPYSSRTVILASPYVYTTGKTNTNIEKPRNFNLNSYTGNQYNSQNNSAGINIKTAPSNRNRPVYNNTNNTGFSNTIKQIFTGGNSNNSYSAPSRSYSPSSSGSSSGNNSSSGSSSSGSSSGGGVSRPTRGGN